MTCTKTIQVVTEAEIATEPYTKKPEELIEQAGSTINLINYINELLPQKHLKDPSPDSDNTKFIDDLIDKMLETIKAIVYTYFSREDYEGMLKAFEEASHETDGIGRTQAWFNFILDNYQNPQKPLDTLIQLAESHPEVFELLMATTQMDNKKIILTSQAIQLITEHYPNITDSAINPEASIMVRWSCGEEDPLGAIDVFINVRIESDKSGSPNEITISIPWSQINRLPEFVNFDSSDNTLYY